ncbi:MAG: hypothetical protein ACFFAF_17555, partial [Candidatus Hermodarchaeota archaeon]
KIGNTFFFQFFTINILINLYKEGFKIKIAKIKGINISLHLSTLLIIGLVGFYAADYYATSTPGSSIIELIIVGLINGLIILFTILIHELIMKKLNYFPIINSSDSGKEALDQLIKMKKRPHLVVVKEEKQNRVIGFIGEEDIVSSLQFLKNQI